MVADAPGPVAILAIHPRCANRIPDGTKCVGFRERSIWIPPPIIVLYATSPIQRVLGYQSRGARRLAARIEGAHL